MALPEQIRKQAEAVQELYKQLNSESEQGGAADATPGETAGTAAPAADAPAANTPAPSPATPEPKAGDEKAPEDITQKYRTLQGMYNAEVPRLHAQNREMAGRIQQMEQLLASLSQSAAPQGSPQGSPQAAPAASAAPARLVTDKDVEEYGESIDIMRKVSREELGSLLQRLGKIEGILQQMQTKVVPQVQAVAQRQQVSAEQQFWADLTAAVPSWREVNDNQAFQDWLLTVDPLTGITRQTYLEDAQRALDARRVSAFFRAWLESTGQPAVAQSTGSASATTPAKSELERQVAPGRARSVGAPTTNQGKIYTPEDIKRFFADVRRGVYKGREQERNRIESDIFAAQRENRIQATA